MERLDAICMLKKIPKESFANYLSKKKSLRAQLTLHGIIITPPLDLRGGMGRGCRKELGVGWEFWSQV